MRYFFSQGGQRRFTNELRRQKAYMLVRDLLFREKAGSVRTRTVSTETASKAVMSMLNLVVNVARRIRDDVPPEMISAIDLTAEMSFVAFSVGVEVDLEKVPRGKMKGSKKK